jgi:hypothetical protein
VLPPLAAVPPPSHWATGRVSGDTRAMWIVVLRPSVPVGWMIRSASVPPVMLLSLVLSSSSVVGGGPATLDGLAEVRRGEHTVVKAEIRELGHRVLKPYPVDPLAVYPPTAGPRPPPTGHARIIRVLIDPYAGPPGLR